MKALKAIAILLLMGLVLYGPDLARGQGEGAGEQMQLVRILSKVEVDQPLITLWHLADHNKPMGDELVARLSATPVGVAPELGKSFTVEGSELRRLINEADLGPEISVLLPASVQVKHAVTQISQKQLREIYEEVLQRDAIAQQLDLVVLDIKTGPAITLPTGAFTYEAKRLGSKWGNVTVLVEMYIDGRRQTQARVSGQVEVYGRALVAARSLPSGHIIARDDIQVARVNIMEAQGAAVSDPNLVLGQRLRSPLSMGNLLDPRRMQREVLVRPGDVVTMICANPNINLSTKGKVEQSGYFNSLIKLTNLNSRQQVYGRVLDSGTVVVEF
jgi:flagella basal body P-ring formation protein FlgA